MNIIKLRRIIENNDTVSGKIFDVVVQILIIISLISFCIETLPNLSHKFDQFLYYVEVITIVIFTIEYLLRILVAENKLKYIFSFYGLIDLLSILPFYVARGIDLRAIRVFRLFRLFRMFKLIRYNNAIRRFRKAFGMIKDELIIFLIATVFVLFVSSIGIYYFEHYAQPEKFASVFHCMWWAVGTLTTVGYGDIYPITVGGKIFTFVILMIGLGIIAVPTALIASALTKCVQDEKNGNGW
jgi:voltage-gated potassium channel